MSRVKLIAITMIALGFLALTPGAIVVIRAADAPPAAAEPGTEKFTLVSVLIGDTKFWLPSTIVVHQGDKVVLTLKNEVMTGDDKHGFSIPAFNITEVVTRGKPVTVNFVVDKVGVFPYICQLHRAHVGGQLIVEPKQGAQPL